MRQIIERGTSRDGVSQRVPAEMKMKPHKMGIKRNQKQ
jgi:hypothetical protein